MKFHLRIFANLPSMQLCTSSGVPLGVTQTRSGRRAPGRLRHAIGTRLAVAEYGTVTVTSLHAVINKLSHIYISGHKPIVIGKLTRRHRPFCLLLRHKEREVHRTATRLPPFWDMSLAKKPSDCSRRVPAIGAAFYTRSIFDIIVRDQSQIFAKSAIFQHYMRVSQKPQIEAT